MFATFNTKSQGAAAILLRADLAALGKLKPNHQGGRIDCYAWQLLMSKGLLHQMEGDHQNRGQWVLDM